MNAETVKDITPEEKEQLTHKTARGHVFLPTAAAVVPSSLSCSLENVTFLFCNYAGVKSSLFYFKEGKWGENPKNSNCDVLFVS